MTQKGLDILNRIKYEIKHNSTVKPNRTTVKTADLESLIDLAESNQKRISLELAKELLDLKAELSRTKTNEKKLISLLNELQKSKH